MASTGRASTREMACAAGADSVTFSAGIIDTVMEAVGASGMGACHGIEGFRAMSHAKGVFAQGKWNLPSLLRAPFGKLADVTLAALLRKRGR